MGKRYIPYIEGARFDERDREPGERVRITDGIIHIDYNVFRKTPAERLILKIAKAKHKDYLRSKNIARNNR